MSEINTGGPAFPQVNYAKPADGYGVSIMEIWGGMSLRDYLAGQALAGFCANPDSKKWTPDEMVLDAYALADKMLFERLVEEVK